MFSRGQTITMTQFFSGVDVANIFTQQPFYEIWKNRGSLPSLLQAITVIGQYNTSVATVAGPRRKLQSDYRRTWLTAKIKTVLSDFSEKLIVFRWFTKKLRSRRVRLCADRMCDTWIMRLALRIDEFIENRYSLFTLLHWWWLMMINEKKKTNFIYEVHH